jgi:CO/xanthine dehydrogenase Mo-binding subunit
VRVAETGDGEGFCLYAGTTEFGNGTSTVLTQLAGDALGVAPERIQLLTADTDAVDHDTGTYGSTGTVIAGTAALDAARRLREKIDARAAGDVPAADGEPLSADGYADGMTRTVAFNVQGFRVAVDPATGEVRILQSVHSADAGTVINPRQCRGQIEGAVAQGLGAVLYEEVRIGPDGAVSTRALREYPVPRLGDLPPTEVTFAQTSDTRAGPLGAKPMSESPFNPVAPALANAVRDATGRRLTELPLTRDRVFGELHKDVDQFTHTGGTI